MSEGYWSSVYWVSYITKAMVWKVFKSSTRMKSSVKIECGIDIAMGQENIR